MEKDLKEIMEKSNAKIEEFNSQVETLKSALNGKVDTSKAEEIKSTINNLKENFEVISKVGDVDTVKFVKELQEQTNSLETKLNSMKDSFVKSETVEDQILKGLKSEDFKLVKEGKRAGIEFTVKASTISTANSFTQTNSPVIPYQRDPEMGIAPRRNLLVSDLVSKGVTNSDYIDWVERTSETTGTAMKAEGAQYGQSDAGWTTYKVPVEKITDYIVVTDEKLNDADFMLSEIQSILGYNIPFKQEDQIFDGTGSSNQLYGLIGASVAKTFAKPSNMDKLAAPNKMDAIKAAILQVALGNTSDTKVRGFNANAIIIRPEDATNMELERVSGSDNQYIIPPFMSADGRMISGVPIYTSLFLDDDTFLVGDFSRTKLWTRQETVINIWDQNSTDAVYGLKTITATKRVALQTKEVDKYAFVTGTFTAAIAAITS